MNLEELARWLDDNADHLQRVASEIESDRRSAAKCRAAAAAIRAYDVRRNRPMEGLTAMDADAATDAALAECGESP